MAQYGRHNAREAERQTTAVLAADLGGTTIKLGVVSGDRVLAEETLDARARNGLAPRLPDIAKAFNALRRRSNETRHIAAVAMAVPALVSPSHNRIDSTIDKYPDAPSLDLTGWCREAFGAPLVLENDANAAMIGEWRFGAGQDHDHAVMMIFGTGVGVSAITDGRLLRGAHGYGGVLGGHQTINLHGRLCPCGNMGCVETEASTWVLQELPLPEGASDIAAIWRSADAGNPSARALQQRFLLAWGACAVNLIHLLDPSLLILGGGVMNSHEPTLGTIRAYVSNHIWHHREPPDIVVHRLGTRAALLGLGVLAMARPGIADCP